MQMRIRRGPAGAFSSYGWAVRVGSLAMVALLAGATAARAQTHEGTHEDEPTSAAEPEQGQEQSNKSSQEQAPAEQPSRSMETVLITGSRFPGRTRMQSTVPVDSFETETLQHQGNGDVTESLKNLLPSFTATSYTGDGSGFVRPTSLRGLPPDQTLVLVNFKRRHRSALIALGAPAMGRGSHPVDIGMIPNIAVKNVEVLRDGAAAQYGSDAIAGVINFILRDDPDGVELQAKTGLWYKGELEHQLAANVGLPLGDRGFLSVSGEFSQFDELSRGGQHTKAADLASRCVGTGPPCFGQTVPNPAQIWGRPFGRGVRLFWNGGVKLNPLFEPYFFGSFARTFGDLGFFYREAKKTGVSSPLPRDPLNPALGNFSWTDPDRWPLGFTPRFLAWITDASQVAGVRGLLPSEVRYDFSGSVGMNHIAYQLKNSINPSWGPESPTSFRPGDQREADINLNADFSYALANNLNLAWGAEWRRESFTVYEGDPESYQIGRWSGASKLINPLTMMPYDEPFVGANGYQGKSPEEAGSASRTNVALYADTEWDLDTQTLVQGAVRFEHFSTFGPTLNGKLAARYILSDALTARGAVSTGFRAPTPGQFSWSSVTTGFIPGTDEQQLTATLPPEHPVAVRLGGRELQPEKSLNISVGFSAEPTETTQLTADAYRIAVDGRIVMSQELDANTDPATGLPFPPDPTMQANNKYKLVQFYTNGMDTVTTGFDLVLLHQLLWSDFGAPELGETNVSLAYNYNHTNVVDKSVLPIAVDERRVSDIENLLPKHRLTASVTHSLDAWSLLLRANYYGAAFDEKPAGQDAERVGSEVLLDAQLTYALGADYSFMLGVNNLLNNFPDETSTRATAGLPWPRKGPIGYHGGMVYLRAIAHL